MNEGLDVFPPFYANNPYPADVLGLPKVSIDKFCRSCIYTAAAFVILGDFSAAHKKFQMCLAVFGQTARQVSRQYAG